MSQSASDDDKAEIESFFDSVVQEGTMGEKSSHGEKDELDICRSPDFYTDQNSTKIGPLRCRLFYHPNKAHYFVFFMKKNNMAEKDSAQEEIHMCVPAQDLRMFAHILNGVCDEIELTPCNETPKSLQTAAGKMPGSVKLLSSCFA